VGRAVKCNYIGGAFRKAKYEKIRRGGKAGGQKFLPCSCEANLRGLPLKPFPFCQPKFWRLRGGAYPLYHISPKNYF